MLDSRRNFCYIKASNKNGSHMENSKQQLIDRIKTASNVLVTVGRNPSVDALSALLGLTLVLNKQGKHAAAVFSGQVPSTIEFLQPEETIEKNTDSLRDFIIALDKNKADKLRYKVEDDVVRIFITPYKTSISQEDFEFSEGDFNIDVIIALGVQQQEDLDEAITAHGRILHDATVATVNISPDNGNIGSINWSEPQASSLSELVTELTQMLGKDLLDEQIATALLTGIVAETDRFSNDKTRSLTMSMSAALMQAGANQQLVASKLDGQLSVNNGDLSDQSQAGGPSEGQSVDGNGAIQIDHTDTSPSASDTAKTDIDTEALEPSSAVDEPKTSDVAIDDVPTILPEKPEASHLSTGPKLMTEPPTLGGQLTANAGQNGPEAVSDLLTVSSPDNAPDSSNHEESSDIKAPDVAPLFEGSSVTSQPPATSPVMPAEPLTPVASPQPAPANWSPPPPPPPALAPTSPPPKTSTNTDEPETLTEIEQAVGSEHVAGTNVAAARAEVKRAFNDPSLGADEPMPAIDALNAQPLGDDLHPSDSTQPASQSSSATDVTAPPPVPPPIPFQFGNPPPAQ
jgi:nanoRNase/pAp phosphatase (c-di-AMP/oligoRNAs hydrolase)